MILLGSIAMAFCISGTYFLTRKRNLSLRKSQYSRSKGASKKSAPKKAAKKAVSKRSVKKTAVKKGAKKSASRTAYKKADKRTTFSVENTEKKVVKENKYIEVVEARYIKDNILSIAFNDGVKREVNFSSFFDNNNTPYLKKYKTADKFKKFKIEDGNVVWGKDWDLIFPVEQLYNGEIE
jgi:hypothetical protein